MTWILTCDCVGRFIKHLDGQSICSKCRGPAYYQFTPKAAQTRQLDVDYECPITGKPIRSKRAHEENLKLHGKHVFEKGELADAQRIRDALNEEFENKVCETAAQLVHDLPLEIQAALEQELLTSDINLTRG